MAYHVIHLVEETFVEQRVQNFDVFGMREFQENLCVFWHCEEVRFLRINALVLQSFDKIVKELLREIVIKVWKDVYNEGR